MHIMKRRNLSHIKGGMYFYKDIHDDIMAYKKANRKDREKIWNDKLENAFNKLVENIINNYKWEHMGKDMDHRSMCETLLTHLILAIEKFNYDGKKGSAFSYFNRTAMNWCVQENDRLFKEHNRQVEIYPSYLNDKGEEEITINKELVVLADGEPDLKEFLQLSSQWWKINSKDLFRGKGKKPKWQKVILAVADMMGNLDNADITFDVNGIKSMRKKDRRMGQKICHRNFCRDLRRITGIPTSHSRHIMYQIEPIQHRLFRHYLDNGSLEGFKV